MTPTAATTMKTLKNRVGKPCDPMIGSCLITPAITQTKGANTTVIITTDKVSIHNSDRPFNMVWATMFENQPMSTETKMTGTQNKIRDVRDISSSVPKGPPNTANTIAQKTIAITRSENTERQVSAKPFFKDPKKRHPKEQKKIARVLNTFKRLKQTEKFTQG
jgi:hypothetical protein